LWAIPKVIEFLGYNPDLFSAKTIGQRIKTYRQLQGITQNELAKEIGIDPATLSRSERDAGKIFNSTIAKINLLLQMFYCHSLMYETAKS